MAGLIGSVIVVAVVVLLAHWPALSAKALSFDDARYLTHNDLVQNPSWSHAGRFFTEILNPSTVRGYYQPLTMISLMLDCAVGGSNENLLPFHRTSLALHVGNTVLVILLLYMLFGRPYVAAMVGLLFGVHPLTVETIPWVGERKTLLAAFFALWCFILYVRYAKRMDWRLYAGSLVFYLLALTSKPTSIPLPVCLLLLDFWPLRRLGRRAIIEKLPFFVVGGVFAVITIVSQARSAAVTMPAEYGPFRVLLVVCHNIIFYLYKIVWPADLSSHYPFPEPLSLSQPMVLTGVIGTCVLIPALLISLRWTRSLLTGWLFFFVTIFPTMGIIGFTIVIASDKYVYLPSVGLMLPAAGFLCWLWAPDSLMRSARIRRIGSMLMVVILASAETAATRRYLAVWQDSVTLFQHMLTHAPDSQDVHDGMGIALAQSGRMEEALVHFSKALQIEPSHDRTRLNMANVLLQLGRAVEAFKQYDMLVQSKTQCPDAYHNLGILLAGRGELDKAIDCYNEALRLKPDNHQAHHSLANALASQGKTDEAIRHYHQALSIRPDFAEAYVDLGWALALAGRLDEAVVAYRSALQLRPDQTTWRYELADVLNRKGKTRQAIAEYEKIMQINPAHAKARQALKTATAANGTTSNP